MYSFELEESKRVFDALSKKSKELNVDGEITFEKCKTEHITIVPEYYEKIKYLKYYTKNSFEFSSENGYKYRVNYTSFDTLEEAINDFFKIDLP